MGFLKKNSNILLAVYVTIDFLVLISSFIIAFYFENRSDFFYSINKRLIISAIIIIPSLFFMLQKFEFSSKYRIKSLIDVLRNIIAFEFITITFFYVFTLFGFYTFSNDFVLSFFIMTYSFFVTERIILKLFLSFMRSRGYNYKIYLIIGAGPLGLKLYNLVKESNEFGIKIHGFLDDYAEKFMSNPDFPESIKSLIIGTTEKLEDMLKLKKIDNVIIALPMLVEDKIIKITNICEKYGIKAELIPDYYKITSKTPSVRMIKGFPLIGIRNVPLENLFNRLLKRLLDISASFFALILLTPFFLIIMIAIKATSKGPVFFKQKRTGFMQKEFKIYKFRTMHVNAEADTTQASKNDPRKTPVGDFLRKTNIDELPQLINILVGDMSLVGPRPHMIKQTEEFYQIYDKYLVRHWVKPGLTGWAQVNGWRGDSDIGMRVKYDIDYIENWTFFLDIKIILLTIVSNKVRKHAY